MSIKQKKDPSEEGKRQLEALRQAVWARRLRKSISLASIVSPGEMVSP